MTCHRFFGRRLFGVVPLVAFTGLAGVGCTETVATTTTTRTKTWTTQRPPSATIDKPRIQVPSAGPQPDEWQCPPNADCGTWVDLGDPEEYCGTWGTTCKPDQICSDGQCKRSCADSNDSDDSKTDDSESCDDADCQTRPPGQSGSLTREALR